ncbi:TetR/AcrR family transcriptional regulator [Mesorhizobium sp. NPDC059054]|uniref:TetR/AcrR family transcriptional regulator n=1 Tax=Mesorhizobium sp. NPDC059054 TaxID=3346711 RepID=UPI0036B9AD7C
MPSDRQKRTNDPEGMRRRVLDKAEESFQARGFHATSLGDVMAAAAVTGGALHHHFPTKKALALAVIEERVAEVVRRTWVEPLRSSASVRAGVRQVFATVADRLERQGFVRGCPLNNLAHELSLADPDFRISLASIFKEWRSAIADKVRADQQAGGEADTDPERFAASVVALYSGAMSMAKTAQDSSLLRLCAKELDESAGGVLN